ncbi:hypothetical protein N7466_003608 [Penicillium verhagenii]|uniref:uncharacterized protein n=1 Tax=Penicillium verhagenii TaxID=1562060 RepID=UPI002545534C|nr:uncharacterized protein N7466_003608 [Penicillium verhagenii]KAJ5934061.1 hypothetical protein N7466_003608 [Penicillium verhagenii]
MEADQFKVRKRSPKACRRCHRRKQRCVGYPVCMNCEAAKSSCTRSETPAFRPASERYHGLSKDALFDRIEELEAQLDAISKSKPSQALIPCPQSESPKQLPFDNVPDVGHLFDVMEYLTTGQVSGQTPIRTFSSLGSLIAKEMDQIFEDTVLASGHLENTDIEHEPVSTDDNQPATPTDNEGLKYIQIYMETMHNHMPYLDSEEIFRMHDQRLRPILPTRLARWKFSKLFMVYAIGAATYRVTETQPSISANDLFRTALRLKPSVTELRSLQNIEAMMLLIMYNLRIPNSSNIWYMIGLAMRTAIDLGLHREENYHQLKPDEAQSRRRVFWSVYVMDRSIARLLDRPFNIAEHDIDVGLPFDNQEPHPIYSNESASLGTSIAAFIPVIRLTRLKSQIQTRVHRVDKEISLLMPEISPLFSALEEYKKSLQSDLSPTDRDWINMHWNNGILILIQPFLQELPSDHELIRTCMRASGQTCQVFKSLHQKGYIGFGYFLVSTLFKAGLTLWSVSFTLKLYTLQSSQPCSIDVANDLGACSSVLFAVAERNKELEKYRDTWEAILAKVMEHLQQVSLSHQSLQNIIRQPALSYPFASSSMGNFGTHSCLSGAELTFLNNLDLSSNILCQGELGIQGSFPSNQRGLLSTPKHLYPEWQEDTMSLLGFDDISKFDEIISGTMSEQRKCETRVFDE